jgi:hypothetical protein
MEKETAELREETDLYREVLKGMNNGQAGEEMREEMEDN